MLSKFIQIIQFFPANGAMKQLLVVPFLCVTAITISLFFSSAIAANCDYEETPISLSVLNKPMTEILEQIAQQIDFTLDVQNIEALTINKSIELDQIPLDQTLKRLLKNVNYSVICDNEKQALTLVLFDKTMIARSAPIATPSSTAEHTNTSAPREMDEISDALNKYNNMKNADITEQEDPEEMRGISAALQDYQQNSENGNIPTFNTEQKTSMDGLTEAVSEYTTKEESSPTSEPSSSVSSGEMAGLDTALNEYNTQNNTNQTEQQTESTSQIDAAFNEFDRLNQK